MWFTLHPSFMTRIASILLRVEISTTITRDMNVPDLDGKGTVPLNLCPLTVQQTLKQRPGTQLMCPCSVWFLIGTISSQWHHWSHSRGDGDQMVKRWWWATPELVSSPLINVVFFLPFAYLICQIVGVHPHQNIFCFLPSKLPLVSNTIAAD